MLVPLVLDPDVSVAEEAMRAVRRAGGCDPIFVPALVARLAHRRLKHEARETLLSGGASVVDALAYLLRDPDEQPWVRRHIPATLGRLPFQESIDALFGALADDDGFIRYKAIEAIERVHRSNEALRLDRPALVNFVGHESGRYYGYLILRQNLRSACRDCDGALVVQVLDDKLRRAVDRIFRALGLLHSWKDVTAARHALQHGNARARADAAEYLDNLLDMDLRRRVLPIVEDLPIEERLRHAYAILKTRPRDLDETLVRLVHADDPVLASAGIHLVRELGIASLWPDIEFILQHGTADPSVKEAASWALASRALAGVENAASGGLMPVIEVTKRLRAISLFDLAPIDELFRIAVSGRRVAHRAGHRLCHAGTPVDPIVLLLEGSVHGTDGGEPGSMTAPCALAAVDALAGRPSAQSIEATGGVQCLEIDLATFVAMLGESTRLAQGVFRMLLDGADDRVWDRSGEPAERVRRADPSLGMQAIDKVLMLREHPLFRRASVDHLLELATIAQDLTVAPGMSVGPPADPAATYYVVAGQVQVGAGRRVVGAGSTVGAVGVLTGLADGWRLTAVTPAHLLCVPSADLFRVVADHGDLLQAFFGAALGARDAVSA
jgi:CRP-like cAMP-binding protein/HEAT repeat protein